MKRQQVIGGRWITMTENTNVQAGVQKNANNETQSLRLVHLSCEQASDFRPLTYPSMVHLFDASIADRVVAIGYFAGSTPVGLAIGMRGLADDWELASVYMLPFWRTDEREKSLFDAFLSTVAMPNAMGCHYFTMAASGDVPAWLRLKAWGWAPPVVQSLVVTISVPTTLACQWIVEPKLPKGSSIVPWYTLEASQRLRLKTRLTDVDEAIDDTLDPFQHEADYHRPTSLALVNGGEVTGWMITHTLGGSRLRWTCSCVLGRRHRHTRILPLWHETALRMQQSGKTSYRFVVHRRQSAMFRLVLRRMVPDGAEASLSVLSRYKP